MRRKNVFSFSANLCFQDADVEIRESNAFLIHVQDFIIYIPKATGLGSFQLFFFSFGLNHLHSIFEHFDVVFFRVLYLILHFSLHFLFFLH